MTQPPVGPPAWGPAPDARPAWSPAPEAHHAWVPAGPAVPPLGQAPAAQPAWAPQPPDPGWAPGEPPQAPPPAGRASRRGLWMSLAAGVVVLLLGGGVTAFLLTRGVDPPTDVQVAVQGDGVTVSWRAVDGATGYEVVRGEEVLGTTEETSYVDAEAPGGTEHTYAVVALDEDGDRSPTAAAEPITTPVDAPDSLTVTAQEADVVVAWEPVTGADRYALSRDGTVLADDLTRSPYTDEDVAVGDHVYQLTAVDEDGDGSSASASASLFTQGPWQEAYQIAQNFAELVSAEPGGRGWGDATCELGSPADDAAAALIYCEYPNGIYVEVLQFSDTAQRDAKTADIRAAAAPDPGTWSYGNGPAEGDLFLSVPESSYAWRYLTFYDPALSLFSVYADWEGHTQDELREAWFTTAPF